MPANQERAEQIIVEILRQSPSGLNKGQLYKTFWLAHLYYAKNNRGYLSDWPVVVMPRGPGIDKGDRLVDKLKSQGAISVTLEPNGPFNDHQCRAIVDNHRPTELSKEAIDAIREAVVFTSTKSSAELTRFSHNYSRGWNEKCAGEEFDIYADLIPEDEIERTKHEVALAMKDYEGLFE